jgi:hypothetical protein
MIIKWSSRRHRRVIKKRGNSWWVVVYTGRDPLTGKKRQKTGTAKTRAEARQLEARLIREAGTGQHRAAGNKTVAELLDAWSEWRPGKDEIAERTMLGYRNLIEHKDHPGAGGAAAKPRGHRHHRPVPGSARRARHPLYALPARGSRRPDAAAGRWPPRQQGQERLASLVAHHSGARFEAGERGLVDALAEFEPEDGPLLDALTYADMTTGPARQRVELEERIAGALRRSR